MNRRNFIKSTVFASIAFPYIGIGESKLKRSPNSLFTIQELKTWCEMNGFCYIEDNYIKTVYNRDKDNKSIKEAGKYILYPDIEIPIDGKVAIKMDDLRLIHKRPFIHKLDTDMWYEALNYLAVDYRIRYKHFFLYDIEESTLPFQKEKGEFYSIIRSARWSFDDITRTAEEQRLLKLTDNVYCIKDKCWYKPILKEGTWWVYHDGFEKV